MRAAISFIMVLFLCINIFAGIPRYYKVGVKIIPEGEIGELSVCALYENKDIAFTTRWDDSNPRHYRMQECMKTNGICGTFFLTCKPWQKPMNVKKLCQGGTDVGSHSMTHARLAAYLNYNRIFWELAESRAILESLGDKPVNSYCFADGNYRSMYNRSLEKEIALMLERSGYTHNMKHNYAERFADVEPVSSCYGISAGDKNPSVEVFESRLERYLSDADWVASHPCLTLGVHVWLYSDKDWAGMNEVLAKSAGRSNWWYCTHTDYAAYVRMKRLLDIQNLGSKSDELSYELSIPFGADVGSDIPLTFAYSGGVKNILVDGKPVDYKLENGTNFFNISGSEAVLTPKQISYFPNPDNSKIFEPGTNDVLQAWIFLENDEAVLSLRSSELITDIRVSYILPLMYEPVEPLEISSMRRAEDKMVNKHLLVTEEKYIYGRPFILCQIDYLQEGEPKRVFASCLGEANLPPFQDGYRDSTMVSGFFSIDEYRDKLKEMSKPDAPRISSLDWYGVLTEERINHNSYTLDLGKRLKPEFAKKLPESKNMYAVEYNVTLDKPKWLISQQLGNGLVFLNGEVFVGKGRKKKIPLEKGKNRIISIHRLQPLTYRSFLSVPPIYRNRQVAE